MLQLAVDRLTYSVLGLDPRSKLGAGINFFIYDSIKIILLLFVMIWVIGLLRSFLPRHKVKDWIIQKKGMGNLFAAIFGAVTPFCSCSSIPIFMGFLEAGIPLGVCLSFLITSPIINEYLVVLMVGFFGWKIALAYVLSGIVIGAVSGAVLGKFGLDRYIAKDMLSGSGKNLPEEKFSGFLQRIDFGLREATAILSKFWLWVLFGVGIGAAIHNFVPQQAIESIINRAGLFSVPIATIVGIPFYANCAAIVPVAVALFQKGVPLGTGLAFMMATAALSLPEAIMLRRAMRLQLIAIFFGTATLAIMITGYLFNFLQRVVF